MPRFTSGTVYFLVLVVVVPLWPLDGLIDRFD